MKLIILLLVALAAAASGDIFDKSKEEHKEYTLLKANKHSVVLRAPRSISKFFRRMIGREKSVSDSPGRREREGEGERNEEEETV